MKCASCSTESDTPFCPGCGLPLKGATCRECKAALAPGAKHCGQCGAATLKKADSQLGWMVGLALVAVGVGYALSRPNTPPSPPSPATPASSGTAAPALQAPQALMDESMGAQGGQPQMPPQPQMPQTAVERADQAFNVAMTAFEGKQPTAPAAVKEAIKAYTEAGELDDDALFHLGLLYLASNDGKSARATAERLLAHAPKHVLGLGVAGQGAQLTGDTAAARGYYQRLLAGYVEESQTLRPEYLQHARVVTTYVETATKAIQ
jgi:hypothetical protein